MAKKIAGFVKLQIPAGKANPAPPVGTALGPQGINIMAFCKEFNARTQNQDGIILPVVVTKNIPTSPSGFILKTPPAAVLLKEEAGIREGFGPAQPHLEPGSVTAAQVAKIPPSSRCRTSTVTPLSPRWRWLPSAARSMESRRVKG